MRMKGLFMRRGLSDETERKKALLNESYHLLTNIFI